MAVTARFLADFSSFQDAVQKADVQLKGMETGANKVSSSLSRMTDAFSGRKLIQDATLAAEAVERIGGTSKLTSSELASVQAQATAAANKLRAMGQDVPPGIQKIADSVKNAGGALSGIKSALGSVAGAFGIAFSVGAVVNFGKQVLDTAGRINDLSSQLGVSTDAVQGFKYAAEQSGSSLDSVGVAINKMNSNLAGGDKATVQALKAAGLQFQTIRSMRPEDAFLAITDAIKGIPDPMKQADVAMTLFGKNGAELLPAIKAGFREVSDAASKMSEDTISSLDDAGDAWGRLETKVVNSTGTILSHALHTVEGLTEGWKSFGMFVDNSLKFGIGAAAAMANVQDRAADAAKKNRDVNLPLPGIIHKTAEEIAAEAAARKKAADEAERYAAVVREIQAASVSLTAAQKAQVRSLEALGVSVGTIAKYLQLTEAPIGRFNDELRLMSKNIADIGKQAASIPHNVPLLLQGTNLSSAAGAVDVDAVKAASAAAGGLKTIRDATFDEIESRMKTLGVKTQAELVRMANVAREQYESMKKSGQFTAAELEAAWLRMVKANTAAQTGWLNEFKGGLLGTLQSVPQTIASALTGGGGIKGALKSIGSQIGAEFGSAIGFAIGGPLGASVGQALGSLVGNIGALFDRNKGRDLVTAFAGEHGGFDALHKELNTLGQDGERLWIMLTQGVGRNNPDQARDAIDEVTAALDKQKQAAKDVGVEAQKSQADQLAALQKLMSPEEVEALSKGFRQAQAEGFKGGENEFLQQQLDFYGKLQEGDSRLKTWFSGNTIAAFKLIKSGQADLANSIIGDIQKLDSQIKGLNDSIAGEAPEEFMGIVESNTRAQIASLEKQREEASKTLNDLGNQAAESMDHVADAIDRLPDEIAVKVRLELETQFGGKPSTASTGGRVGFSSVVPFAKGGQVGTDTVPAMLTPGEIILNAAQQQRLGQQLAGQPLTITVPVYLDSEQIGEGLVRMAKRKGLR